MIEYSPPMVDQSITQTLDMPKKPPSSDPQLLENWLDTHKDEDKVEVDGVRVPLVLTDSVELSGHVHADDYNLALKYAAPWGCRKSGIGTYGVFLLTSNPNLNLVDITTTPTYTAKDDNSRLFRCKIPEATLEIAQEFAEENKLNRSQLATLVLRSFNVHTPVQARYDKWLLKWSAKTGLDKDHIETILYNFYRIDGASKRYNLAKAEDPEAGAEKMT